jgi:hypothetical protein
MVTSARTLTTAAWGLFFILVGGAWMYGQAYGVNTGWIIAIGVGLILIGLNIARRGIGVRMGQFSLGIGILALVIGLAQYAGLEVPLPPLIIILIGLFILAEAIVRR